MLDPAAIARAVVLRAQEHVCQLIMHIDLGLAWSIPWTDPPEASHLGHTVRLLTGYAQRGLRATDWPHDGCARDAILDVVSTLYTHAGDEEIGAGVIDRLDECADLDDPLDVVLVAGWGRHQIAAGESVTPAELAALAGLTPNGVRDLARRGELRATGENRWRVSAREAARWLASRGVDGFAQ